MSPTTVGTAIARGGQTAHEMSQDSAAQPSAFDVWTHSYDGMSQSMQAVAENPASLVSVDTAQLARASAAAMNLSSASANQIENSMAAQASALGESVTAIGQADGALQTVGATFAMLTGAEQLLSTLLSAIPFPSLPAVRILDFDIGLPHAHTHPPNLIPPAPPIPLPSIGPVIPIPILSGATTVLINGMPAGRCGDMGLGVWCGGYFPMYEVFLGSSNVWIEGSRAARLLVDITKHCLFTIPKPSDPPLGPMIGTTISASFNVLIGGFPMPSLTAIALGAAMKGAFKLAGKGAKAFARVTAPLRRRMGNAFTEAANFVRCRVFRAEPVNFVTGEVNVEQKDFSIRGIIPLEWNRYYASQSSRKGVCGYGWSTLADARLTVEEDGAVVFNDGLGGIIVFPYLPQSGSVQEFVDGSVLDVTLDALTVRIKNSLNYVFLPSRANTTELLLNRIEDACGNFVRFVRDADGLREMIESAGRRIEISSQAGLVREMRIRISEHGTPQLLARYEYSDDDELIAVYDALENPYRFRYDNRRLVQHTNRTGLSFYYEYDSVKQSARCVKAWGDGGLYNYTFAFDSTLKRITITDSLGASSIAQLNELNLPIWEMDPLGSITQYEYDDRGRTIAVKDRDGHGTSYQYDERGNLLKLTRADGSTIQTAFNDAGRPITLTDPNGAQWTQKWDPRGLLIERVSPLGYVSRFEYDGRGQLFAFTNARGGRTQLGFDTFGNLTRYIDAMGRRTRFAYDALGNLTGALDALERKTLYRYDAKNRLTEIRMPTGAGVSCEYDAEGNLVRHIDERGMETRFEYCGLGLVKRRYQADGHVMEYTYDTEERLIAVTNQRGETYHLKRDALGRVAEEVDYWGQSTTYEFDSTGHLRQTRDPLGQVIHFTTDKLGRIRSKRYADPLHSGLQPGKFIEDTFEFDPAGNLLAFSNEQMKVQRRFDVEGRLVEEHQGDFVIKHAYNELSNRIRCETSTGNTVRYEYDLLGQITSIQINNHAPIEFERDAGGQVRKEKLNANLERLFEYDGDGRLTSQGIRRDAAWLFNTQYQYDAAGNLTVRRDSRFGTDLYEYDPLGQVTRHTNPQGELSRFFQDPAGDRLHIRDREGSFEGVQYRFDAAGNLIQRNATQFTWDANHHLARSETDGVETLYGYDALGRRVFKKSAAGTTRFYWDGDALAAEHIIEGGWREYVYYPTTFKPFALVEDKTFYYYNDPNGCPTRVVGSDGETVWAANYTPWGAAKLLTGNASVNPLRFQGQYADDETGLHYNRHRYFDPHIGQFISPDALGLNAGSNLYQYARNALVWTDPLGLDPHDLEGWIERNGQEVPGTRAEVQSGGLSKAEAGRWGLKSHTEPKYLKQFEGDLEPGDIVRMKGSLDPCSPGCQPLLRDLVHRQDVSVVYEASTTGRTWTFRKPHAGEFPRHRADLVVEIAEANGKSTVRRYWQTASGKWTSRVVPKCG
jgi:RHS repeat-associated protein